jgi:pre-mRNA-splicing factor ATP-dependent RNA helicase DHX16
VLGNMSLKDWVSDQLYELVELSDENMVDLLINLSARATSSSSLEGNIRDKLGLSRDTRVNDFANQLYLKIPRREVQGSLPSKKRNTGTQSPSTAQYKWIDSESDTNEPSGVLKGPLKKKRHIRIRTALSDDSGEESGPSSISKEKSRGKWNEESRVKDIKERDAFVERLKEKDKSKTRKVVERSNKKVRMADFLYAPSMLKVCDSLSRPMKRQVRGCILRNLIGKL